MGKLIKNHWARLIILTASFCTSAPLQTRCPSSNSSRPGRRLARGATSWPKIFWDFLTTNLDGAVKPIPILQVINTVFGLSMFALELPVKPLAGTLVHQSIEFRLMLMPLLALAAIIMYQGTNAAVYYAIGEILYFWAYSDGEVRSSRFVL